MTAAQALAMLRRKLADVDVAALRQTDAYLMAVAEDMRLELAVRQVQGFEDVTVGTDPTNTTTFGIQGATDDQAVILVYSAALAVLESTYRERINRGELGISWRSGLEEESTISAEKAYRGLLDGLAATVEQLLLTYQRRSANRRIG